jgi:hypothetical protein
MTNEVSVSCSLAVENGDFRIPQLGGQRHQYDQSAVGGGTPGTHTALIAGSAVNLTGVTTGGWCYMRNTDDTNYVEWGLSGSLIGRMEPGEEVLLRLKPGAALFLIADVANCECQVSVMED